MQPPMSEPRTAESIEALLREALRRDGSTHAMTGPVEFRTEGPCLCWACKTHRALKAQTWQGMDKKRIVGLLVARRASTHHCSQYRQAHDDLLDDLCDLGWLSDAELDAIGDAPAPPSARTEER